MSTRERLHTIIDHMTEEQVNAFLILFGDSTDPFYSSENIAELESRIESIKSGTSTLKEHDLIEVDD